MKVIVDETEGIGDHTSKIGLNLSKDTQTVFLINFIHQIFLSKFI